MPAHIFSITYMFQHIKNTYRRAWIWREVRRPPGHSDTPSLSRCRSRRRNRGRISGVCPWPSEADESSLATAHTVNYPAMNAGASRRPQAAKQPEEAGSGGIPPEPKEHSRFAARLTPKAPCAVTTVPAARPSGLASPSRIRPSSLILSAAL